MLMLGTESTTPNNVPADSSDLNASSDNNNESKDESQNTDTAQPVVASTSDSKPDDAQKDLNAKDIALPANIDTGNNADDLDIDEDDEPLSELCKKLRANGNGRAKFTNEFHGLKRKHRRERNYPCDKCEFTCKNQGALNKHYLDAHGTLQCEDCGKSFKTVSAHRMHLYEHGEPDEFKKCMDCDKSFPFESQLKAHRKTHLTALQHQCVKCSKWFKNKGECVTVVIPGNVSSATMKQPIQETYEPIKTNTEITLAIFVLSVIMDLISICSLNGIELNLPVHEITNNCKKELGTFV